MSTQEIIVFLLVFICLGYVFFRYISKKRSGKSPCENCPTGCELHTMMMEKEQGCKGKKKK
jgi:uncharacterized protein YneF (UPF0154 family)